MYLHYLTMTNGGRVIDQLVLDWGYFPRLLTMGVISRGIFPRGYWSGINGWVYWPRN